MWGCCLFFRFFVLDGEVWWPSDVSVGSFESSGVVDVSEEGGDSLLVSK